ncbi:MAG: efflux RND transporter permease subunit [Oligosphaeraceae bacterium]
MFLSSMAVRRPIAMTAFIIVLVLIGASFYQKISVDLLPNTDIPTIKVACTYEGASPDEIEVEISKRIEDAVASVEGLKHVNSVSMEDQATVHLEFEMGTDVDIAATDIREKLNKVRSDFPVDANEPTITKIDANATTVVQAFLVGDCPIDELYDYADDVVSDRLSSVSGVGEVTLYGANEMQLHVLLDRRKLTAMNLPVKDVVDKLEKNNVRKSLGRIQEGHGEKNVTYYGDYEDFDELLSQEIGQHENRRVYLRDVAEVKLVSREIRNLSYVNGKPAVRFNIIKKGEANALKVIGGLRQRIEQMTSRGELPSGMELVWFSDSGAFIQASVDDAWQSIVMGIALTAVLLFLFLHQPRTTFIVMVSMPVSIVVTFAFMAAMGYTFNIMTLLSMGCSVGVLVTNSIVVIENIFTHLSRGDGLKQAAEHGTGEVILAVSASALTNVVVFVPVMLMTTRVGTMMVPFAGVMVVSTLVSLFISFTLTPILACVMLRGGAGVVSGGGGFWSRVFRPWDLGYDWLCRRFNGSIEWSSRHPWAVLSAVVAFTVAVCALVVPQVSLSFLPNCDQGEIRVRFEFPTNYNLATTERLVQEAADHLKKFDFIRGMAVLVGDSNAGRGQVSTAVYTGQINLKTSEKYERKEDIYELQDMIRRELSYLDNCRVTLSIPATFGGGSSEINCVIVGPDLSLLEAAEMRAMEEIPPMGLTRDMDSTRRERKPNIIVRPKRTVLHNLGGSASDLYEHLLGTLDGVEVGSYRRGTRTFDIRVKFAKEEGYDQLRESAPATLDGNPLSAEVLADIREDTRPVVINRYDKNRTMWLYANAAPGVALSTVSDAIQSNIRSSLPNGYTTRMSGNAEMMSETSEEFHGVIAMAAVLTYLLMAAILESWLRPLLIMFTVPLGFLGMYVTLWLARMPMSLMALLGGVMMIGIVVNNAILMIDECTRLVQEGMESRQAMVMATERKFRPIVMTSLASVAGMLPMALGTGLGSELRVSCGLGVVGGLLFSSLLTLYVIPSLHIVCVDVATRWLRRG